MAEKQFKKSVSGTLATGIILEKELNTNEVFNELIKLQEENKELEKENGELKQLIKETLEITPIEHSLAVKLKNSIRGMYE